MKTRWHYPLWIAHRGAGKLAPENTLAAFRLGASHGFRAFECDVKLSADGVPFLLHDETLERTTNGQGTAGELPWNLLSGLDAGSWHSNPFAGERLPSLEQVAQYVIERGFALNLEIKPTPDTDNLTGRVVAMHVRRLWAGHSPPPLLSSFRPAALAAAGHAAPELPRALLLDDFWSGWFEQLGALGCVAAVVNHKWLDAAVIDRLHAAKLRVLTYTVNDRTNVERLLGAGIDGIITDAVDEFAPDARALAGAGASDLKEA